MQTNQKPPAHLVVVTDANDRVEHANEYDKIENPLPSCDGDYERFRIQRRQRWRVPPPAPPTSPHVQQLQRESVERRLTAVVDAAIVDRPEPSKELKEKLWGAAQWIGLILLGVLVVVLLLSVIGALVR